jgi:hypothetical protein
MKPPTSEELHGLRSFIALLMMHNLMRTPTFDRQLNESAEDDHVRELGRATAIDAFDLADAFIAEARNRS